MNAQVKASRREPQRFEITLPDGRKEIVDSKNVRDGIIYDTVYQVAGLVVAGTRHQFFQNIQGKEPVDTNLTTQRRLATGEKMKATWFGLFIPMTSGLHVMGYDVNGVSDMHKVLENTFLRARVNKQLVAEGPGFAFPCGLGVNGSVSTTVTDITAGVLTNGMPATRFMYRLTVPQWIFPESDLDASLEYQTRANWAAAAIGMPTLTNALTIKVIFGGKIWGVD